MKAQEFAPAVYHRRMVPHFDIALDRRGGPSLVDQISGAIRVAIDDGVLAAGARLPSWRDLATQLGVARGTVRQAYERLVDAQMIVTAGAAGTHVAARAAQSPKPPALPAPAYDHFRPDYPFGPAPFQMGVPAQDAFPVQVWARVMAQGARTAAEMPVSYRDPRGEPALRAQIAAHLAISRGLACDPAQVFVTNGFSGALDLVLRSLDLHGATAWTEEPGFPIAREAVRLAGLVPAPVRVDAQGLDVAAGIAMAPHAALAMVTPGQQAPLGVTLSLARRHALLDWAARTGAWIIEDDYLGELQPDGRAAPALASLDRAGRVCHVGTFSKTITPSLRTGFVVVPPDLVPRVLEVANAFLTAPALSLQHAVAAFIEDGRYLRHLRRMKRLYLERRRGLVDALAQLSTTHAPAGLGVLLRLPDGVDEGRVVKQARAAGLAPVPLSPWYVTPELRQSGLLLGVTNVPEADATALCRRLLAIVSACGP